MIEKPAENSIKQTKQCYVETFKPAPWDKECKEATTKRKIAYKNVK